VRWTIKEPERYLFQLDNPDATIRAVAESAMRATVANFTLVQAIGSGRTEIEQQVQQRMQQILDRYRSGIRIEGVAVRDADPPNQVEEAFNNVNAARQRAESERNRARAYAEQVERRAEGDAGEFNAVYAEYRLAPEVTRQRIYYETMERILRQADKTIVEGGGVTPYLPLPEVRRRAAPPPSPPASGGTTTRTEGARP
jgi:modulator of FtsH protease HflK